jgi:hypothetical protein
VVTKIEASSNRLVQVKGEGSVAISKKGRCQKCRHQKHKPSLCTQDSCFCPRYYTPTPNVGIFKKVFRGGEVTLDMSKVSLPDLSKDDREFILKLIRLVGYNE